ncbi:MAG TPA: hypothetical protein VF470_10980 [Sphingomicrobium sp.]
MISRVFTAAPASLIVLACLAATPATSAAQSNSAASAYPGAVQVNHPERIADVYRIIPERGTVAYLTKDDPAKVAAWYKKNSKVLRTEQNRSNITMLVLGEVNGGEMGKIGYGVTLVTKADTNRELRAFDELHSRVVPEDAPGFHSQSEYDEVHGKYEQLNKAIFNISDDSAAGTFEQDLYQRTKKQLADAKTSGRTSQEALMKKVQAAAMSGNAAEAQKLMKQFQGTMAGGDPWDSWLEYLEKVDAAAFRTLILIDRKH